MFLKLKTMLYRALVQGQPFNLYNKRFMQVEITEASAKIKYRDAILMRGASNNNKK